MLMNFSVAASDMTLADAGFTALFGYLVVFCGLAILMIVIQIMGNIFKSKAKKAAEAAALQKAQEAEAAKRSMPEVEEKAAPLAPGSAGHVKRFDVPDKEAAMIMAIVANQMNRPLNELRFISIKEVKENEV